jgi:hypothetical protein
MQVEDDNVSVVTICIENDHKDDYIQIRSYNNNEIGMYDGLCHYLKLMGCATIASIFILIMIILMISSPSLR